MRKRLTGLRVLVILAVPQRLSAGDRSERILSFDDNTRSEEHNETVIFKR
jgi:hypothetical protein